MTRAEIIAFQLTITELVREAEARLHLARLNENNLEVPSAAFEEAKRWRDKMSTLVKELA